MLDHPEPALARLEKSKFRASFHLNKELSNYIDQKGTDKIRQHAYDFINQRLRPPATPKDGRQTPMKNHPVFIAQHATATCCRGCLEKWYQIPKDRGLTDTEVDQIVTLLMTWLSREHQA